ncbi:MAG: YgeY family selenium metabolism-linked hydrolase [Acidimicrobiales bacterium]
MGMGMGMGMGELAAVRERAERQRGPVVDLLREVVHIPSLSSDESSVVERLAAEMRTLGYDEVYTDGFGSLVGRIGDGPVSIVYDSHIDTVATGSRSEWARDPFEPHLEGALAGGIVHGRGASDDKAGICSMIHGAALYKELCSNAAVTLYVVGSVQEEDCDGLALEHVLTKTLARPDLVVLGEATRCGVYRGNRGRIEVMVRARGSSCHASAPERGHNPVYDLSAMISEVQATEPLLGNDDFLGPGTIAITKIECETPSLNAVPATATLYIDRRLTAGEAPEEALRQIAELPAVRAAGGTVELLDYERTSYTGMTLGMAKSYPSWTTPADHAGVRAGSLTGELLFGKAPEIGRWVFSTNGVASMGKLGIPTIGFGPGDEAHAHTAHDQCPTDDLVQAIAWYAAFPGSYVDVSAAPGRDEA